MAAGAGSPRLLALILLGILAVRLVALWLAQTDLFFDEAQYWSWAKEPALGYYSKPPLIAWAIAATTAVCGDGEACVRSASPILHTVSAWVVSLIGCRLYGARAGFWSGIVFATLPGIGLSSGIISTDVPFLLCWALALWGFVRLRATGSLGDAILLGAAIGSGFMARYSMVFFVGSMLLALVILRGSGTRIGAGRWLTVALVALLVVSPNLYWNAAHGFPTFGHTADNAKWSGSLFHPLKALEFFGAQFGVFGPVLFGALLVIVWRALFTRGHSRAASVGSDPQLNADRLLLCFVLPILLIYIVQAFVSRAHANWAAAGYVAATVLVVATMFRDQARRWFQFSLGLHAIAAAIIAFAPAFAGWAQHAIDSDPFRRVLGWRELADATRIELRKAASEGKPYAAIVIDDRGTLAEHLYYLRDLDIPILAWPSGPVPKDHYEMTRPYRGESPVLMVSQGPVPKSILNRFSISEKRLAREPGSDPRDWRPVELYRLDGYRPVP